MRNLLAIWLVCTLSASGAISASGVYETRTTGTDTNGGGFVTGASGTDMSLFDNKNAAGCTSCQSATVNISTTDGVAAGTTTITSATGNYSAALIGNIVRISGGTGSITAGWYQVLTVPGATSFTVDRSTGLTAGTGVTINIGGALLSPSISTALLTVAGQINFIKSGTYSVTATTVNTAAGVLSSGANGTYVQGYSTNRTIGNTDTQPVIQDNVSTATLVFNGFESFYTNLTFDGNSQTAAKLTNGGVVFLYCTIKNFNTNSSSVSGFLGNMITANSAIVASYGFFAYNEVFSNTSLAARATQSYAANFNNLYYANTGANATTENTVGILIANNVAVSGANGFGGIGGDLVINSIAESNVTTGFPGAAGMLLIGGATYNNGTAITGSWQQIGTITNTTGSFFTNAGAADFSLNNLANQGALVRSLAYAGYVQNLFPRGLTATKQDIGAAQHGFVTVGVPSIR